MKHTKEFWDRKYKEYKKATKAEMKKYGIKGNVSLVNKTVFQDMWETAPEKISKVRTLARTTILGSSFLNANTRRRAWKRYVEATGDDRYENSEQWANQVPYSVLRQLYEPEIAAQYKEWLAEGKNPRDFAKWVGFYYYGSK